MKLTTTKKAFQVWLESKKTPTIVGFSGDGENCPLAKYFTETNNIKKGEIRVTEFIIGPNRLGKTTEPSPWMVKFMTKVDDWPLMAGNPNRSNRISAKRALEFLQGC